MAAFLFLASVQLVSGSNRLERFLSVGNEPIELGSISLYVENDKFFAGTDRNYTAGFKLSALSANLRGFDDPSVASPLRELARLFRPLMREGATPKLGLSIGQNIYTPEDTEVTAPQPNDRPYVAWLYLGAVFQNYHAGVGPLPGRGPVDRLDSIEIQVGAIGNEAALGAFVQNGFHRISGAEKTQGWGNAIRDEPAINFYLERKWRYRSSGVSDGWGWDVIPRIGGSLGTVFTHLDAGAAVRFGYRIPADFGTNLIRPTGDSNPPDRASFSFWTFATADGLWVMHDATLDGGFFRSGGPSVAKRRWVADYAAGVGVSTRRWQLTYAQAVRSREFKGQPDSQVFGSISLSYFY